MNLPTLRNFLPPFQRITLQRVLGLKRCASCCLEKDVTCFDKNRKVCKECRRLSRSKKHSFTCASCGEAYTSAKKDSKYCSRRCHANSRESKVVVLCTQCGKTKEIVPSLEKRLESFFCNQNCRNEHLKSNMIGEENPNYKRVSTQCSGCSKPIDVQPYRLEKHKYQFCTSECYLKNIGKYFTGEHNQNWNGSLSAKDRERLRLLPGYREWRNKVFFRDKYSCQVCKDSVGGNLVAHHLNSWDVYPGDRFSVENGVTLCKNCHNRFHKEYGYGKNTKEQFEYFTI